MSTRCMLRIFSVKLGKDVYLYHHHDGYIKGVGYDLLDMFYDRNKEKIILNNIDTVVNKLIKKEGDEYEYTAYNHIDIEYLYTLDVDNNKIVTYEVACSEDEMEVYQTWDTERLIETYKIDREVKRYTVKNVKEFLQ